MTCFLAWCAALLLLPLIVLLWATESPSARVRRWQAAGLTDQQISERSRHAMRQALAFSCVEA